MKPLGSVDWRFYHLHFKKTYAISKVNVQMLTTWIEGPHWNEVTGNTFAVVWKLTNRELLQWNIHTLRVDLVNFFPTYVCFSSLKMLWTEWKNLLKVKGTIRGRPVHPMAQLHLHQVQKGKPSLLQVLSVPLRSTECFDTLLSSSAHGCYMVCLYFSRLSCCESSSLISL